MFKELKGFEICNKDTDSKMCVSSMCYVAGLNILVLKNNGTAQIW